VRKIWLNILLIFIAISVTSYIAYYLDNRKPRNQPFSRNLQPTSRVHKLLLQTFTQGQYYQPT
jgi:hypothetical protein